MKRFLVSLLVSALVTGALSAIALAGASADISIEVKVTPATLVLASDGTLVTVHTDIALSAVDTSSLTLNGVPVAWTKADAKGNLVAKFDQAEIKPIVSPPSATLELVGSTKDGRTFAGTDTIVIR